MSAGDVLNVRCGAASVGCRLIPPVWPRTSSRHDAVLAEISGRQATLRRLREARALTQSTVGDLVDMDQSEISRLERRSDMLLSTLKRFVQATGGEMHIVVSYPTAAPSSSSSRTGDDKRRVRATGNPQKSPGRGQVDRCRPTEVRPPPATRPRRQRRQYRLTGDQARSAAIRRTRTAS